MGPKSCVVQTSIWRQGLLLMVMMAVVHCGGEVADHGKSDPTQSGGSSGSSGAQSGGSGGSSNNGGSGNAGDNQSGHCYMGAPRPEYPSCYTPGPDTANLPCLAASNPRLRELFPGSVTTQAGPWVAAEQTTCHQLCCYRF